MQSISYFYAIDFILSDNLFSVVIFVANNFVFYYFFLFTGIHCPQWLLILGSFDHFQGNLPLHDFLSSFLDFFYYYVFFTILIFWSRNKNCFSAFLVFFFFFLKYHVNFGETNETLGLDLASHLDSISFTHWFHDLSMGSESIIWKSMITSKGNERSKDKESQ